MADIGQATDLNIGSFAQNLAIAQQGAQNVAANMQNAQNYQIGQMQIEAAKAAQESQKQFQSELSQANGDPAALQQLALKYPSQAENIGKALGIKNEAHASQLNQAVGDLTLASKIGTDQSMAAAISKHRQLISDMGSTPQELFQTWKSNPQQFQQIVNAAGMATVPYQKQQELDAQNYRTDATLRGQDLQFKTAGLNRQVQREGQQIQREGLEVQRGNQQITRETNEVNREATQQKIAESQQKQIEAQQKVVNEYSNRANLLAQNVDALQAITGPIAPDGTYDPKSPQMQNFKDLFTLSGWAKKKIPGTKEAGTWADIQGLQAQARQTGIESLKGTGGSVTDADAKGAQEALLAIQENTNPQQAQAALNRYINTLQRAARSINSPQALRRVGQAKATSWGLQRNVDPRAVQKYIEAKANGVQGVDEQWAEAFPGIEPPQPGDFQ
ncbi:TPA: phage DNA ejection protein [Enterobacter bugandensis]|nr:phage DNA ejection protein [Enterobacter bugandensis]